MLTRARLLFSRIMDDARSLLGQPEPVLRPASYFDLIDMFGEPGCAVCNRLLHDADRFLDSLLYEMALDEGVQQAFRDRRGLCSEHSGLAAGYMGHSLSLAVLSAAALDEVLAVIEQTPASVAPRPMLARLLGRRPDSASLADRLEPHRECLVCRSLTQAEQRYIHVLSRRIGDARLREAYTASDGLCLPHFRLVLRQTPADADRDLLLATQTAIWQKLKVDLDGMIAKSDHTHQGEMTSHEGGSWRRAPARLAGERGVFGPDRPPDPPREF